MLDECLPVDENSMLRDTFESMQKSECHALPVLRRGQLVGLLTQDNIAEWLMIRAAEQGVKSG
jgi:predicted transcriptional regulator